MGKQKFQNGDKVIITCITDPHYNQIGYVYNSWYNKYNQRTAYNIKSINDDKFYGNYYTRDIKAYITDEKKEILPVKNNSHSKMVIIFDEDIFKNAPANVTDYVKRNATKINVDGTVLKNRYGRADVKEKVFSISLEDAQKMYKNGGSLKELVLKLFTEEELNPKPKLPHNWAEYCADFYPYEYHLHYTPNFAHGFRKEDCDAMIAFGRLVRVYRTWIGKWKPNWDKETAHKTIKYCIINSVNGFIIQNCYNNWIPFFAFPTKEMAEDFMNSFKDLLEKAKILI